MGKRGPKPKGKVEIKWSPNFAYAIGLITSDGCLSRNGRCVTFVSKDEDQVRNFTRALGIEVKIGYSQKHDAYGARRCSRVQLGDVLFCRFLLSIGLMPNKSKVLKAVEVPEGYFFDFLRGLFDGDGSIHSYYDSRWKSSFMFYTIFASASAEFILWLQNEINGHLGVRGHITHARNSIVYQLKFAKADSIKILRSMYHASDLLCLSRKRLKVERILHTIGQRLQ